MGLSRSLDPAYATDTAQPPDADWDQSFGGAGWPTRSLTMVSLNTHFFGWNLPKGCQAQLDNFVKDGHRILCVAFPPDRADA